MAKKPKTVEITKTETRNKERALNEFLGTKHQFPLFEISSCFSILVFHPWTSTDKNFEREVPQMLDSDF